MKYQAVVLVAFSLATSAFADSIYLHCGKNKDKGHDKAEVAYSAMTLQPESPEDFSLTESGKENKKAASVVVLEKEYLLKGYVITEKKKAGGYRQFVFSKVHKCHDGENASLQIYEVGTGEGKKPIGKKKSCLCGID